MKQENMKCSACGENRGEYFKYDPVTRTTYCVTCRNKTIVQNSVDDVDKLKEAIKQNGLDNSEGYAKLAAMCQEQIDKTGDTVLKLETVIGFVSDVREELKELRSEVKSQGEEIKSQIDKQSAKIDKLLTKSEQEVENLHAQLRAAMSEKYISGEKVKSIAQKLSDKSADDLLANFCEAVYSNDSQRLNAFLDSIDSSKDIADVELIIEFVINDLQSRNVTSLKSLVSRLGLAKKYMTKVENEAEIVDEGIYNPQLKRDIFVVFAGVDEERVTPIVNELEEQGFVCFYSLRNLRHGKYAKEVYWSNLYTALRNCKCVVFCSSDNSRKQDCDALMELAYVHDELVGNLKKQVGMFEYILDEYSSKTPTPIKNTLKEYFRRQTYYTDMESLGTSLTKYIQNIKMKEILNNNVVDEANFKDVPSEPVAAIKQEVPKTKADTVATKQAEPKKSTATNGVIIDTNTQKTDAAKSTKAAATKATETASAKPKAVAKPILIDFDSNEFEIVGAELKKYKGKKADVIIPDGVTSIGEKAFYCCNSLQSIKIPDSVTSIGKCAFYHCSSLTSIEIPSSVTSIGAEAFEGCSNLKSLDIPSSVTSLASWAFRGCWSLTSIEIPSSVTSIGRETFSSSSLTSITVDVNNPKYKSENNCLIEKETNALILGCQTSIIPDYVTSIDSWAFIGCDSFTSIEIPSSVTSIGREAFESCSSLTYIEIPNSVTSIGYRAFASCSSLTCIEIPNSVTSLDDWAFDQCRNLTIYCEAKSAPSSWANFWNHSNCRVVWNYKSKLKAVAAIKAVKSEQAAKSEPPVKSEHAFSENTHTYKNAIGYYELGGCEIYRSVLVKYIGDKASVTIPSMVNSIGEGAFAECSGLTSVVIPKSVTSIGKNAFQGCSNLTSIELPSKLKIIGDHVFQGCSSLTSIKIPSSVTSIGKSAFSGCSSLTSIRIPSSMTSIDMFAFHDCSSLTSIDIPDGMKKIGKGAFSGCSNLTNIEIPSSLTSIVDETFCGCRSMTSLDIPSFVASIGYRVFYGCSSLTTINFGGKKKEWKKINYDKNWKQRGRTIYCSDGKIKC